MTHLIGKTLSRYEVLEQIGAGGMGTVYRARDQRLHRDVALKVLPAGALADDLARHRFRKEALALSQLNHPNIAIIHDFDSAEGVDFLVMEYIEGTTVNAMLSGGPLPERDILQFGHQAALGLAAAHERGIVHRDLKPANLRVTPDRRTKILDFGLAELFQTGSDLGVTATATSASTSGPPGTLPYMSPEQLREEKVDHRTDIYSLGAVLYEISTGQRPFPETRGPRLIDSILHHHPTAPRALNRRLSPGLENIVLKCLDKDPDRRYQSARELGVDLNRLATGAAAAPGRRLTRRAALAAVAAAVLLLVALGLDVGGIRSQLFGAISGRQIRSIAVLPLENLSGDPDQEYFADGMTEALISELTRIRALRVISRWSVMQYKGVRKPLPQIARELGVDGVVLGSVRRTGDRVHISAQLIHASSDVNLWARNFDVAAGNIQVLQNDVVRNIVEEIQVQLTPQEQAHLAQARPVNPQAHEAYLRGRYHWNKRTPEGMKLALAAFQRAVGLDAGYAPAYVGLADTYAFPSEISLPHREAHEKQVAAARKALELDPTLAEAHTSLASAYQNDWDWQAAERSYRRAIELNPNYATARHWFSTLLTALGRHDEAVAEAQRALELDPLSMIIRASVGGRLLHARRLDEAEQACRETVDLDPTFPVAIGCIGMVQSVRGEFNQAAAQYQRAAQLSGGTEWLSFLGYVRARAGKRTEALAAIDQLRAAGPPGLVPAMRIAIVYTGLGEKDEAFRWLEQAYKDRDPELLWLGTEPMFDPLHGDPRFADLLQRIGVPAAP